MSRWSKPKYCQLPLFDPFSFQLPSGTTILIDPIDVDLSLHGWYIDKKGYARRKKIRTGNDPHREVRSIHRIVLGRKLNRVLKPEEWVDHIDGNKLNNRRNNLRIANPSQNQFNKSKRACNTSGYKGVTWSKASRKWQAGIYYMGKSIHLGMFDDPILAHEAYKTAAVQYAGEFARFD